jgi:hypothetical protein
VLDVLLRANHRVYLHCTAGLGRSPGVAIAYQVGFTLDLLGFPLNMAGFTLDLLGFPLNSAGFTHLLTWFHTRLAWSPTKLGWFHITLGWFQYWFGREYSLQSVYDDLTSVRPCGPNMVRHLCPIANVAKMGSGLQGLE